MRILIAPRSWFAAIMLCMVAGSVIAQTTVEVIPLKYRNSEQLIPVIQPLLGRDSSVSGFQNQLVIRATPAELAQVKNVLASLDRAPKRLLITVRQNADAERSQREAEVSGSIGNDHARVTVPGSGSRSGGNVDLRNGGDRLSARIGETQQSGSSGTTQTVQVLEGYSAFIGIGESRPVRNRQVVRRIVNGQLVDQVIEGTEYVDVTTGFSVVPRLQGDLVTLDIDPRRESFDNSRRGAINVQGVVTTVSGRLGEWMDLGGVTQSGSDQRSTLLGRGSRSSNVRSGVQVKVEVLP